MTTIERIREALADECDRQQDSRPTAQPWSELDMTALARIAVAAMRETTDDVSHALGNAVVHPNIFMGGPGPMAKRRGKEIWQCGIDAILNEEPKP